MHPGYYKQYSRAHFLEAPNEYFAVIGSIFLYGKRIDQPQFIEFLTEQFGPHPGK